MTKIKSRRQWKNFLINPRYQIRYVFWVSFTGLALILINGCVFYWFISENYKILVDMSPMEDEVKAQLYRELYQILIALGAFASLFIFFTVVLGITLSHRTAGPMYHFKRVFREIQNGNFHARVKLRPKDDFQDVAEECNKMIEALVSKTDKA